MTTQHSSSNRIVVGVDGSDESKEALRCAVRLASIFGPRIDVVAAWHMPANFGWSAIPPNWEPAKATEEMLHQTVDDVFGADLPVGLAMHVIEGSPGAILVDAAKGAGLLIVGRTGHNRVGHRLLGSVSRYCVEHAQSLVMVVEEGQKVDRIPVKRDCELTKSARS